MKHNQNHDHGRSDANGHSTGPQLVPVRFEFNDPKAISVCVAGTFNNWQPESKVFHSSPLVTDGIKPPWHPPFMNTVCVDGQWMPDPLAKETVPSPFGGRN